MISLVGIASIHDKIKDRINPSNKAWDFCINLFHDSICNFKVLDEKRIKLLLRTINDEKKTIVITLKNKIVESFTIYEFRNDEGNLIGKVVDNNLTSDLESLNIEIIDFVFTNLDLTIYACDSLTNELGNDRLTQFCEVDSVEIN